MASPEVVRTLFHAAWQVGKAVWSWLSAHAWLAVCSILVALTLTTAWSVYDRARTKEIQMLLGPAGGSALEAAEKLVEQVNRDSDHWFGTKYRIQLVPTNGFEENRKRINKDQTGRVFGFAHDGFGDDFSNLALLAPLEWNHLHIICSNELYEVLVELAREQSAPRDVKTAVLRTIPQIFAPRPPSTNFDIVNFRQIAECLAGKYGRPNVQFNSLDKLADVELRRRIKSGKLRMFLGPADSGTRQLAELVLTSNQLWPSRYGSHGITDWNEMRSAFLEGRLDVAFYSGPLHSSALNRIAGDKTCRLVGLNGRRDSLVQSHLGLVPGEFHAGLYSEDLCPHRLEAIASRRVLICSKAMPESDAYFLASATAKSIAGSGLKWNMKSPELQEKDERGFTYDIHPGAAFVRDRSSPGQWPFTISGSTWMFAVLLFLASEIVSRYNNRAKKNDEPTAPMDAPPGAGDGDQGRGAELKIQPVLPSDTYARLLRKLRTLRKKLAQPAEALDDAFTRQLLKEAHRLRSRIHRADEEQLISREQAAHLLHLIDDIIRRAQLFGAEAPPPPLPA